MDFRQRCLGLQLTVASFMIMLSSKVTHASSWLGSSVPDCRAKAWTCEVFRYFCSLWSAQAGRGVE